MPARKKTWFLRSRSRANNTSNCVIPFRFSISSAAALSSSSSSSKSRGPNDPSARLSTRTPFDRLCPPHSVSMASPSPSCSCPSSARAICSSRDLRAISVRASVREPLVAFCFTSLVSVCLASAASAIEFMVLLRARSTSSICRMALRICCCGVGLSPPASCQTDCSTCNASGASLDRRTPLPIVMGTAATLSSAVSIHIDLRVTLRTACRDEL
mmetsp:Transcript_39163/g.97682  ORF Transcript_39163/g.97682 Transcript_39163/m.97682 type:complete len:214 (+) Transcript_39163:95-736(+)